jgi:hypothetical protein
MSDREISQVQPVIHVTQARESNHRSGVAGEAQWVRQAGSAGLRLLETHMTDDKRDVLEVLKFELAFLEQGGYGRSVKTPWKPTSIFQDSLSCINFNDPERPHPCAECLLNEMVPNHAQSENIPCHHIPLNKQGETVDTMERQCNQQEMEEAVKSWLRTAIARIETERSKQTAP